MGEKEGMYLGELVCEPQRDLFRCLWLQGWLAVPRVDMFLTYTLLIGVEQHQKCLQYHFERVDIFSILGQGSDEPAQSTRRDRSRVFFGEASETQNGSTSIF
jgi:hypothetical protein